MNRCTIAVMVLSVALGGLLVAFLVVDYSRTSAIHEFELRNDRLRDKLGDAERRITVLGGRVSSLTGYNRELVGQNAELEGRIAAIEEIIGDSEGLAAEAGGSVEAILAATRRAIKYLDEHEGGTR